MLTSFFFALLATFLASTISLALSGLIVLQKKVRHRWSLELSALAAGVLIATATLHLIPEAIEHGLSGETLGWLILAAITLFFFLERFVVWMHHHHEISGPKPSAWLVTIGDGLHNFLDGFAIASAFSIDTRLGIITTIAIIAHEIPHEIADFIVLLRSGLSAKKALFLNLISAATAFIGVIFSFALSQSVEQSESSILAASAGMFLYIALSDLIPELHNHGEDHDHHNQKNNKSNTQAVFFLLGIVIVSLLGSFMHLE